MNRLGKVFWSAAALLTLGYALAYLVLPRTSNLSVLADVATLGTCFGAVAFIAIWTVLGFQGRAKWWRQDIGTVVVMLAFGYIPQTAVLAWAILFNHGSINTPFPAWMYVGGLLMSAITVVWASVVWLRNDAQLTRDAGQDPAAD
jgi:hypothetical protein